MKHLIRYPLALAVLCALISLPVHAGQPAPGYIDFGKFSAPFTSGEFVEVNIKSNLISMVARLAGKAEPEIGNLLGGLKLVRVNVIGLNDDNRAEMDKRIGAIRSQLDDQGWDRIVTAKQKNDDVGVYVKLRGDEAVEGLVVTVIDGKKEAVLINIVGDIRPEKIALVGEKFNLDPLKKVGAQFESK